MTQIERLIKRCALEKDDSGTWRGFTLRDAYTFFNCVGSDFRYRDEWCAEPYRLVWVNEREHAIFTYCEGDLSLTIESWPKFYERLRDCRECYEVANQ